MTVVNSLAYAMWRQEAGAYFAREARVCAENGTTSGAIFCQREAALNYAVARDVYEFWRAGLALDSPGGLRAGAPSTPTDAPASRAHTEE